MNYRTDIEMKCKHESRSAIKRRFAAGVGFGACLALCNATQAAGDAVIGKAMFATTCANCHSIEAGVNKVGPTLFDIVGRPIASVQGYEYSAKMRAASKDWKVWDDSHLNTYLNDPRRVLKGVRMFYAVPSAKDRTDLIAYLDTLK
jgi:cytochrome c